MPKFPSPKETRSFFEALESLADPRDNRGKRHYAAFVLCGVLLALMIGRSKPTGIYRFISNRFDWLCEVTCFPAKAPISLAQLYRFLEKVDWDSLNTLMYEHFQFQKDTCTDEWFASDGKALRGSSGQQIVSVRGQQSQMILVQKRIEGKKSSEITAVRDLFEESDLWDQKHTLDALHFNPMTTARIHQKGGGYLIQVKENQPELLMCFHYVIAKHQALGQIESVGKGHGRFEQRKATFYSLTPINLDKRWKDSGLITFMVMERTTEILKTGEITRETAYYATNQVASIHEAREKLFDAVRGHWGVESDHWIRDVTFQEDRVKSSHSNRGQIMALMRTLVLYLFRKAKIKNMPEAIDTFCDSASQFQGFLRQVNFL